MAIIVPPREVHEHEPTDTAQERMAAGGYDIPNFTHLTRSETGGMLAHYEGHPVPRKGLPYPDAVAANNQVKRVTLALLMPLMGKESLFIGLGFLLTPKSWKIKFLKRLLDNYIRLANSIYDSCDRIPYLKKEYYCECSKGLWSFVEHFLLSWGLPENIASDMGKIAATIMEYDDAYRFVLQDLLSETDAIRMSHNPSREIKRLLNIYKQRDDRFDSEDRTIGNRISLVMKAASFLLRILGIKKAFRTALSYTPFHYLQISDEYDRYWCLPKNDYKFFGRGIDDRLKEMQRLIDEHAITNKEVST